MVNQSITKEAKVYNGETTGSSISGLYAIPHTKINSKWITDLNVRPETLELLKENIGRTLFDISLINAFLDLFPQARDTKINK